MKNYIVPVSVNLAFALNVVFHQSLFGLAFLFTMFLITLGVTLQLIYKAVNDSKD